LDSLERFEQADGVLARLDAADVQEGERIAEAKLGARCGALLGVRRLKAPVDAVVDHLGLYAEVIAQTPLPVATDDDTVVGTVDRVVLALDQRRAGKVIHMM